MGPVGRAQLRPPEHLPEPLDHAQRHADVPAAAARPVGNRAAGGSPSCRRTRRPQLKRRIVQQAIHIFGPAGLLEQDDGENWSQSTRARPAASPAGELGQHIGRWGSGHDEVTVDAETAQRYIEGLVSEHGQRWLYRAWTEWMAARDWAELKANHSPPPTGVV